MEQVLLVEDKISSSDPLTFLLRQAGPEVPVIGNGRDTVPGLGAGADDCVTKPFSSGALPARMRALLRVHPLSTL